MRFALCFFAALNLFSKTGVVKVIIRKQVYVGINKSTDIHLFSYCIYYERSVLCVSICIVS